MSGSGLAIGFGGERLVLLPERAAFHPDGGTLYLADPHFGKAAAFRAGGLPVPGGTTGETLARLEALLAVTDARRIVFLGDFLHARTGRVEATLRAIEAWRRRRPHLDLLLVRGNHDRHAGDPPPELDLAVVDEPVLDAPFVLAHDPEVAVRHARADAPALAGHLHPAARLRGPGRARERLPCFWLHRHVLVLPAFGEFTGSLDIAPVPGDRVFCALEDRVLEFQP